MLSLRYRNDKIMKKYKRSDPEFGNMLINKALEKYVETVESVKAKQDKIKAETGKEWYEYYTFDTKEEWENWRDFCINAMMTQLIPKMSKQMAEKEFAWFDLAKGLKQQYLYNDK